MPYSIYLFRSIYLIFTSAECIVPFDCAFNINTCNGQSNLMRKNHCLRLRLALDFLYLAASIQLVCFLCLRYVLNNQCVSCIPLILVVFRPKCTYININGKSVYAFGSRYCQNYTIKISFYQLYIGNYYVVCIFKCRNRRAI